MYSILRAGLFQIDPERAHGLTLLLLRVAHRIGILKYLYKSASSPFECMGLTFKNKIGLAAGLDLNAEYVDALADLGFGFIEVGGVSPNPQIGNPKPRLFRLKEHQGLINRKGFANTGLEAMVNNLKKVKYDGVLGINIAKNRETPAAEASKDYLLCFKTLAPYASYFSINVSSPNTPGHRDLQQPAILRQLLMSLKQAQTDYKQQHNKYIPLVVKVSPDLSNDEIKAMAAIFIETNMDGVIATNTTITRDEVSNSPHAHEVGGLSGKPLQKKSNHVIRQLHQHLQNRLPIIGLGGVMDKQSAQDKLDAGASLLQIYSGLIYQGPGLIRKLLS